MFYNDIISYNHNNIAYNGTLILNVVGIDVPIIINDANIIFNSVQDTSNFTTMGIITYDIDPYGIMTFEVTEEQAEAIINATFIVVDTSAEVEIIPSNQQMTGISDTNITTTEPSAEIKVTNISTNGTLLVP